MHSIGKRALRYRMIMAIVACFFIIQTEQAMMAEEEVTEAVVPSDQDASSGDLEQTDNDASLPSEGDAALATTTDEGAELEVLDAAQKVGNWRKKKHWLVLAYGILDEIGKYTIDIEGLQDVFHERYREIDGKLDDFYNTIYLEQGKLNELFASIERHLNKKRDTDDVAVSNEEEVLAYRKRNERTDELKDATKEKKRLLEQLKLDLQSIEDLDQSLTARLEKVKEEVEKVGPIATQARELAESLWDIIDHNDARAVYFKLNGQLLAKVVAVKTFLSDTLLHDFDAIGQTIQRQIAKIQKGINVLEDQGVIIKNRVQRVEELRVRKQQLQEEVRKKAEEEHLEQERKAAERARKKKVKPQLTWYEGIYQSIMQAMSAGSDWIMSWFVSPPKKQVKKPRKLPHTHIQPAAEQTEDIVVEPQVGDIAE